MDLSAQNLPKDLEAAVTIAQVGSTPLLIETMIDYRGIQQNQLDEAYKKRDQIIVDLNEVKASRRHRAVWSGVMVAVTALCAGSYFYLHDLGNDAYDDYMDATISEDATEYRDTYERYDLMSYTGLGLAGVGAITSIVLFAKIPSQKDLQVQRTTIEGEIQRLEGALE